MWYTCGNVLVLIFDVFVSNVLLFNVPFIFQRTVSSTSLVLIYRLYFNVGRLEIFKSAFVNVISSVSAQRLSFIKLKITN